MFNHDSNTPYEEAAEPSRENARFIPWRLAVLGLLAFGLITIFCLRIYFLTAIRGQDFFDLSEENFLRTRPIEAPRGKILAEDGTPLSQNRPLYEVRMSRFRLDPETIDRSVAQLAILLDDPKILSRTEEIKKSWPSWKPVVIAKELDSTAIAPVIERLFTLPGVEVEPRFARHHPGGAMTSHITGHVGAIAPAQLLELSDKDYLQTDVIGKLSAERQFEDHLRGRHGSELTIYDAFGRMRSSHVQVPAERGNDVRLTIDLGLQQLADGLLQTHSGVLIVMDPRNGAILALSSKPDYDPNHPMRGIATQETSSYNKAIRGRYAPGSTFKLVTAAAGLIHGFDPTRKINCPGRFHLPNVRKPFFCDVRWGHGPLNMEEAIQRSCNVFFYTWADRLGHERLYQVAREFGFGAPTGIDLMPTEYEPSGILPDPSGRGIYRGSIVQMGIGQGALISATPLQILGAYAAVANNGTRMTPHVLDSVYAPRGDLMYQFEPEARGSLPVSERHLDLLKAGLYRVVHSPGGTGFGKGLKKSWDVAGKTGSSEVSGQELTDGLWVCYAPASAPEIAMLGIVEAEGHGGSTALPLVAQLMAEYFEPGSGVIPESPESGAANELAQDSGAEGSASASAPGHGPSQPDNVSRVLAPSI